MSSKAPTEPPDSTAKTVLLITVDSLRLDRLHASRNGKALMPNTVALSADSLTVETGVSPGAATRDSVPSILTGAFPSQFPGFTLPPAGTEPLTIAERLAKAGFSTAAFNQNNLISRRYHYDRGFDVYYDISVETREQTGRGRWRLKIRDLIEGTPMARAARWAQTQAMERFGKSLYVLDEPGDSLTDRAIDWLENTDGQRFLWMHFMDTHHPYLAPVEIQRELGRVIPEKRLLQLSRRARSNPDELSSEDIDDLRHAYDCAVRFVDHQIGRFIDHLEARDEYGEAVIVVTADHGEEFMEHGKFGHRTSLWDELITVPLIVRHPEIGNRTITGQAPVRLVYDTLVKEGGLFDVPPDEGISHIIAETSEGPDGMRCCRTNEFKLMVHPSERTFIRIAEEGERIVDEADIPSKVLRELDSVLDETYEPLTTSQVEDEEALKEDLAALGYLEP